MKLRSIVKINFPPEALAEMGANIEQFTIERLAKEAQEDGATIVKQTENELETTGSDMTLMECYERVANLDVQIGAANQDFAIAMFPDMDNLSEELQELAKGGIMHREEIPTNNPQEERAVCLTIGRRITAPT